MDPNSIRSFIAVELSEVVRRHLEAFILELKKSDAAVGWVKPEGVHLTLKFLGDISPELVEKLKPVLAEIGSRNAPIHLQPVGCGAFPNVKQPRVIWVGLSGESEPLIELQKQVETAMVPFGFRAGRPSIQAPSHAGTRQGETAAACSPADASCPPGVCRGSL